MKKLVMTFAAAAVLAAGAVSSASAAGLLRSRGYWHDGGYVDPQWTTPHAMVMPPTVHRQIKYGWGASGTELKRIPFRYSMYGLPDGAFPDGAWRPAPVQPSHTDQMGTYYIRAPWK